MSTIRLHCNDRLEVLENCCVRRSLLNCSLAIYKGSSPARVAVGCVLSHCHGFNIKHAKPGGRPWRHPVAAPGLDLEALGKGTVEFLTELKL
jgi:hypothetical protein